MRNLPILLLFIFFSCETYICDETIQIEAKFMQYACGKDSDEIQILKINHDSLQHLVGRDIDPLIRKKMRDMSPSFYKNRTEEFGMTYRLWGFFDQHNVFGCSNENPRFLVSKIERLNGDEFHL